MSAKKFISKKSLGAKRSLNNVKKSAVRKVTYRSKLPRTPKY